MNFGYRVAHRRILPPAEVLLLLSTFAIAAPAQTAVPLEERVKALSAAVDRVQSQIDASQQELADLRRQLRELTPSGDPPSASPNAETADAAELASAVASIRETQSMQQTQIATLEQSKVESESKYPVKINGLILMTGFVNTSRVDDPQTPSVALGGYGSTGATVRQTLLGIDARGPHVFGAESHGSLRLDFDASAAGSSYTGSYALGLVRLRTAGAELIWQQTRAYFALDRPLLSPETPSSLTAVSLPALAWSGNLWAWNPQMGVARDWPSNRSMHLRSQLALISVADPPALYPVTQTGNYTPPSTTESSRWPGTEGRIALVSGVEETGTQIGLGGYFAPHRTSRGVTFDSWAASVDVRVPLSHHVDVAGTAYRGLALGGMGAGAYKDYVARFEGTEFYYRALDDVGGWAQLKQRVNSRLEFNQAFGIDNVPASQLRPYAIVAPVNYYNLARNRTITANVIYSPSAYVLLSLEYRRIASSPSHSSASSGFPVWVPLPRQVQRASFACRSCIRTAKEESKSRRLSCGFSPTHPPRLPP
jgi:hypothetical protein